MRLEMDQRELAAHLGIKTARVGNYERGTADPTLGVLRQMLDGMGFDFHDLQDALDMAAGRPPKILARDPLEDAESPVLAYVMSLGRLFAVMVAQEVVERLPAGSGTRKRRGRTD
jgi:transcriptional regulator with XRE-family HTH domain